ncbi:MAG: SH3 domain-containing protein [Sulfurimonas sp.]|uniref:SH3 domain-containing C40 family peptidase n=1 Tax=Sulfurimonas sp. TaxID=2022749 RepID=UPI002602DDAD|nr:SH3 domain-containing C40 family peptidase [Sulfurimonas sp.]MDD2652302.1 SH3 domain-containing protein [Sulfurimonas sp.]MDD3451529.1 SH3 domain-containing protein [Sulfurimonas sp.]
MQIKIILLLVLFFFSGCALHDTKKSFDGTQKIADLEQIPQDGAYFCKNISDSKELYEIQKNYNNMHFYVWNMQQPKEKLESIKWAFNTYRPSSSYGENLQKLDQNFFDTMLQNANFDEYGTLNAKGLTLRELNLRVFPTIRPLLRDPSLAGEGFPFDYLQNSTVHANSPIFISHYSKNREWAYVFASFASGWVRVHEFVILEDAQKDFWQNKEQLAIIKEGEAIYDMDGNFLFSSKIGMVLPYVAEDETSYIVAVAKSGTEGQKAVLTDAKIKKEIATKEILPLNADNLATAIHEVSKTNYGWGGMYEQRDCSSTLRDMFTPFGIWLPRNSYQQGRVGKVISLKELDDEEKIKTIKENAIPFQTLLYKKGHVVLYVGTYNDEIIVFHNVWGIRTKQDGIEGRIIIGKPIFSTLRIGKEQPRYDKEAELLKTISSMNIITGKNEAIAKK